MKILIVEDDVNSRVFLERALLSQGYIVESAANGVQALEKAFLSPPDLIISDIMMPEMDGFELCRRVKTDERIRHIPFVFYTATYVDQKDEKLAMALGASRFLIKPMEPAEFFNTISRVIEEHKARHLPVPDQLLTEITELDRMQIEALARKLDKKVRELEKEREALLRSKLLLRQTQQEWEDIFQAIGHPVIILDAQHNILSVNRATIKAAGAGSAEELTGRKCYEIFHSAGEPPKGCPLVKMLASVKLEESEMEVEAFGGIYLVSCTPVFDEKGDLQKIIHIATDITERKRADEELQQKIIELEKSRKEAAFLADLIEQSSQPLGVGYPDGRLAMVNSAFCRLVGYSRDELLSINWANVLTPPEWMETQSRYLEELRLTGQPVRYEKEYIRKDGTKVPVELFVHLVRDGEGQPQYYYSFTNDITERKLAEKSLRKSEEKYRTIVENLTDAYYIHDIQGRILDCNENACRMLGYAREELIGENLSKIDSPENIRLLPERMARIMAEGKGEFDGEHIRKDGSTVPVTISPSVVSREGQGRIQSFVRDITERKRTENKLHALSSKQEAILAAVPEIIMEVDANKVYTWANQAGQEFFGEDVIGKAASFYFVEEQKTYDIVEPLFKGNENIIYVESWQRRKDGEKRLLAWWCRVLKDNVGNVTGALSTARDITDSKRNEESLRISEERYRSLIENQTELLSRFSPDGNFIFVNDVFCNFFGKTRDELIGKKWLPLPVDEDIGFVQEKLLTLSPTNPIVTIENRVVSSKGDIHWIQFVNKGFFDLHGDLLEIQSVGRDITERKSTEESLRKEKTFSDTMINSLPGIFYLFDENGHFMRWNRNFEIVSGYSSEEMGKIHPLDLFSGEEKKLVGERIQEVFIKGKSNVEANFISKNGSAIPYYFTGLRFISDNKPYLVGMGIDIAKRKQAEEGQRINEHRISALLELSRMTYQTDQVLTDFALEKAIELTGSEIGYLAFMNEDETVLTMYSWSRQAMQECMIKQKPIVYPVETTGLWGEAVRQRKPVITNDYQASNPLKKGYPDGHVQVIRHMNIPLFDRDRIVLVAGVGNKKDSYGESDIQQLTLLMDGMWKIIKRMRTEEEIRKLNVELEKRVVERTAQLEASNRELGNEITERKQKEEKIKSQNILLEGINWIVREALTVETEEELSSQCLAIAEELTGSRFGFIDELNEAGTMNSLTLSDPGWEVCKMPHTDAAILLKNIPVRGIYADAIKKGISLIVNDPASHPDRVGLPEGHPPITVFLGVPLKQGEKVIGLIGLANKESGYNADDQQAIEMLSVAFVEALNRIRSEHLIKNLNKELQQSIEEVTHANKELEAFSYSVSHDLRAPLRAIDGFAEILMREYGTKLDDEGKRICSIITGNSKKMGQLIDELLSLSRLGRAEMHFSPIDMNDLANAVYDELTTPEMRQRINFHFDDLKKTSGDSILIRQVWMNLISNAVKFTSHNEQPVISITRREEEEQTVFCVKDNGAGFNMQYAGKLFGVFQRLHSDRAFEGTGVGLAIVQRIVHRHGGKVWAEGEVDKGATFCFSLPK
jgi:PAS domain S-box-containing protein